MSFLRDIADDLKELRTESSPRISSEREINTMMPTPPPPPGFADVLPDPVLPTSIVISSVSASKAINILSRSFSPTALNVMNTLSQPLMSSELEKK